MACSRGLYYWPAADDESCEPLSVVVQEVPPPVPQAEKSTSRRTMYKVTL